MSNNHRACRNNIDLTATPSHPSTTNTPITTAIDATASGSAKKHTGVCTYIAPTQWTTTTTTTTTDTGREQ